jgi:hypothetical protein
VNQAGLRRDVENDLKGTFLATDDFRACLNFNQFSFGDSEGDLRKIRMRYKLYIIIIINIIIIIAYWDVMMQLMVDSPSNQMSLVSISSTAISHYIASAFSKLNLTSTNPIYKKITKVCN